MKNFLWTTAQISLRFSGIISLTAFFMNWGILQKVYIKMKLLEKFFTKIKMQRDVLPWKALLYRVDLCAPPKYKDSNTLVCQDERMSLCVLKGSLTVEASLILPFFLMVLLSFFSFFSQYASAAELKNSAAAEAKKTGLIIGNFSETNSGDVTIYKSAKINDIWINPFYHEEQIAEKAVCRAWIGFTELELQETYVYVTPEGSVYHLYADCTHLELSVHSTTITNAKSAKNAYGQNYSKCELCKGDFGSMVYITYEGERYHSERNCGGLKRTIRQIPMSQVNGRGQCLRCGTREENVWN